MNVLEKRVSLRLGAIFARKEYERLKVRGKEGTDEKKREIEISVESTERFEARWPCNVVILQGRRAHH